MKTLIIGAAGVIGRKLVDALLQAGTLDTRPIRHLILADIITPERPGFGGTIETVAADPSNAQTVARLIAQRPDLISHLAAIGFSAEASFDDIIRVHIEDELENRIPEYA